MMKITREIFISLRSNDIILLPNGREVVVVLSSYYSSGKDINKDNDVENPCGVINFSDCFIEGVTFRNTLGKICDKNGEVIPDLENEVEILKANDIKALIDLTELQTAFFWTENSKLAKPVTLSDQRTVTTKFSALAPDVETKLNWFNENEAKTVRGFIIQMLTGKRTSFVMKTGSADKALKIEIAIS